MKFTKDVICAEFKTIPYRHQLYELETHGLDTARALLWQPRTGKSKVVIDSACLLYTQKLIDTVIVFAPNGVHENWAKREIVLHHWETINYLCFTWSTELKLDIEYNKTFKSIVKSTTCLKWFCFSSTTMIRPDVRKLLSQIIAKGTCLAVFDESHDFRTPGSKRSKLARALASKCSFRRILTGTVVENSPLNAWGQYELLKKGALGYTTYTSFKNKFAQYTQRIISSGRMYTVLTSYINLDILQEMMAKWSSVILRTDCIDLPNLISYQRIIQLTSNQIIIYKKIHKSITIEINDNIVSISDVTNKIIKLQQIVSGYLNDEFNIIHVIPGGNPRLDTLINEVLRTTERVIIWCQFRYDIDIVVKALKKIGRKVVEYHGRISVKEKEYARELMGPDSKKDFDLVGQAQSGGAGLDLSAAGKIIWYSHTFDAIVRTQANERATNIGGNNITVVDLVAPGVDKYILNVLNNKQSMAEMLSRQGLKFILSQLEL